jgi:hypothetical protein
MPFKKVGSNEYSSPSGRHFNGAQVRLYYANGGKFPGEKTMSNKGYMGKSTSYAQGGPVLGKVSEFLKAENEFTDPDEGEKGDSADEDQKYGKTGAGAGKGFTKPPKAAGKSLKPVKPRS